MIDAASECFTKMFTYVHGNISLASNTNREQVDATHWLKQWKTSTHVHKNEDELETLISVPSKLLCIFYFSS
jgi:hypothetical protein